MKKDNAFNIDFENFLITECIPIQLWDELLMIKNSLNNKQIEYIYKQLKDDKIDYEYLKKKINDPKGLKLLTVYIIKSIDCYDKYKKKEIDLKIYIDTFKCYSRFIKESKKATSKYVFDRYYWTYRFSEFKLFRIGELEYEVKRKEKEISIHIPSDASLKEEDVNKSIQDAKLFFKKYFKTYSNFKFVCSSWLLSSTLKKYLGNDSNIIKFQNIFNIVNVDENNNEGIFWIFNTYEKDVRDYKEETSLQKNIKQLLLNDGFIGTGFGILK